MSERYTTSLDEPAAREAAHAGEKAAALARLRQGGLPVPAGFVVHASAYDAVTGPARQRIASLLATEHEDAAALERAAGAARTFVEQLPIPEALTQAVAEAYRALGPNVPVAVRSSGTAEDLAGASFAGQYDSFLNVIGLDDVLERMRQVWGSLYSSHAIAYREQQGLPHEGSKMAVLVQTLLPAEAAGVMFTRDPLTGDESRMVVNSAFGLGEGVVAGEASSDVFTLDSATFDVIERNISAKTTMVRHVPGGGTELTAVAAERRDAPSLDDDQLRALGRLAAMVRELEGGHRDIEFAVSGGEVHLLQARPVTGLDSTDGANGATAEPFEFEWEDPADRQHAWVLSGGFTATRPIPRFEEDVREVIARNLKILFEETGAFFGRNHLFRFFNGYAYTRAPQVDEEEVRRRTARQQAVVARFAAEGHDYYLDVIEPEVMELIEALGPFRRPANEELGSRMRFLEQAIEANGHVMGDLHWRMAVSFGANTHANFAALFAELTGEPEVNAGSLLQGLDNETTRLVRRLRGLARLVRDDFVLARVFVARDFDRLDAPDVKARPASGRFRARFLRLLRDRGRRTGSSYGSSTIFATPTWNLAPSAPLEAIAIYAGHDLDELDRLEREARRERVERTRTVRRGLSESDLTRFDKALGAAQRGVRGMENHNAVMEQGVHGVVREAIWWMGAGLVRHDMLDEADDALHLSLDELRAHVASGGGDLRSLVAERKIEFDRRSRMKPPRFVGDGDRSKLETPPAMRDAGEVAGGLQGTVLSGVAASGGSYTGRARVVLSGAPISQIESGDILVARNAGQDITPVLPLLGAIVLDEGAIFQHAALVAREYRIPAVIQTLEATRVIADGQRITVDGEAGTVDLAPA